MRGDWIDQPGAVKTTVFVSVVEISADPVAHHEAEVFVKRNVPGVEYAMDVSSQKQTVVDGMGAAVAVCTDMRGFERGKNPSTGNCALPGVGVRDGQTEGALA
jgi:hypothetical protein